MGPSRVEATRAATATPTIATQAPTYACMAGICEMGPIGACNAAAGTPEENQPITSWPDFQRVYGSFTANARDLPLAAWQYFNEGGRLLYVSRIVRCTSLGDPTTRTSASGTLTLVTGVNAASAGVATGVSTSTSTYVLVPAQTLSILIDALGAALATFSAADAHRDSATGPFALSNGLTLTLTATSLNGAVSTTVVFGTASFADITAATPAEVVTVLNDDFSSKNLALNALVVSNTVRIRTVLQGSAARLNITGGSANAGKLAFTTGSQSGSGNVANIIAVTLPELKLVVETATSSTCTVTSVGGIPKITSNTTGGSSLVQVQNTSTATAFGFDNSPHHGGATGTQNTLIFTSRWDGLYSAALTVQTLAPISGNTSRFDLFLLKNGTVVETWRDCSMDPLDVNNYVVTLVNLGAATQRASIYVTVADQLSTYPSPGNLPAVGTFGPLAGGADGLASLVDTDFTGSTSTNGATGLRVFNTIPRIDEAALPGRTTAGAEAGLVTWCEIDREGRTFFVLGSPAGYSAAQVRNHVTNVAGLKGISEIGLFAWPRVLFDNPDTATFGQGKTITADPTGAIMGLHSRVDRAKVGGSFTHPSNANGRLLTGRGVETNEVEDPTKRGLCQDDLICTIRSKGGQVYVDGARTLKDDGPFPSVGESRGVMLIQSQIIEAYEPLRNANIGTALYSTLASSAEVYLRALTDAGCFRSRVYTEAFFVDFGPALNTTAVVDARSVIGNFGVNTSPPAELISVSIVPFRGLTQAFAQALAA